MTVHYADDLVTLHLGDAQTVLAALPAASVDCIVTSPPYFGLRDYGVEGALPNDRDAHTQAHRDHNDCRACREENYERAKADPVAAVVLMAMHQQDAATYNGLSDDMGRVALDAAAKIREALSGA